MSDIRNKQEVIERLCDLATNVGEIQFKFSEHHDCFCGMNPLGSVDYRMGEAVIKFIEDAVYEKLGRV